MRSVLGGSLRRPRFGQLGYGALAAAAASGAEAGRLLAPAGGEWSTAGRTHVYVGVQPGAAAEWHQVGVWGRAGDAERDGDGGMLDGRQLP